jgi:2'-5' RNA ligase
MNQKRIQLTLFIDPNHSKTIENIRQKYNPLQYALIKSHVTLWREDELIPIEKIIPNLENLTFEGISIDFGEVIRFSDGQGVFIPSIGDNEAFQNLRKQILEGIIENPRRQEPHITLMHPRNSICTEEVFEEIKQFNLPKSVIFSRICLIEQELGGKWEVVREFC